MTLKELYSNFGENYEQALRVLRIEKLMDKHIRKLIPSGLIDSLLAAAASEISEEFRPGKGRKKTDAEVAAMLEEIAALYKKIAEEIRKYEAENP